MKAKSRHGCEIRFRLRANRKRSEALIVTDHWMIDMVFKPFPDGCDSGGERSGPRYIGMRFAIVHALACAEDIDATGITVTIVDGGVVILEGMAPSERDIERAMEVAIAIAGDVVHNRMWREH